MIAILAAGLVAGCTSSDQKAAEAAAQAQAALEAGNIPVARVLIGRALALRDDNGDYWLQLAQIATAAGDYGGAFDAYENVVTLDKSNVDALRILCQIALSANAPERASRYADQLAVLQPADPLPKTIRAALALKSNDKAGARKLLDEVLAGNPADVQALLIRSKLLVAEDDYAGAAKALEDSLAAPGDQGSRLAMLKDLYRRGGDLANYDRTVARLARAKADDAGAQIEYAATLYDSGDRDSGFAISRHVLEEHPDDVATAGAVLNLWLAQGRAAMPVAAISAAANLSLEARATFGQYGNEFGHPDLAMSLLSDDAPGGSPTPANSDAKAAFAYAAALTGNVALAKGVLGQVLQVDEDHPRALLARARIKLASGDLAGAISDARQVVSGDDGNAAARLTLVDALLRQKQPVLAESVLREGVNDPGASPQLAERLAAMLRANGRADEAAAMLADYARSNPTSRRARALAGRK